MLQTRNSSKGFIFSSISLALIFLITIFALSFLSSYLSLHSPTIFFTKKHLLVIQEHHLHTSNRSVILRSDNAASKSNSFNHRLEDFFKSNACDSQFFMTWISPAPLFGNRETLAIETLFKSHPKACLVILSDTLDSPAGNRILNPVISLGFRILAITPDIPLLLHDTPALKWYRKVETGEIDVGEIPFSQNLSNLLRLVVLYKYGGIYLDTDFIVLRNFAGLRNSICAQSMDAKTGEWWRLNNAVLIFDKQHPLVLRFIEEFVTSFNGSRWGHNGPYLVSRVIQSVNNGGSQNSFNFTVLPPAAFYPVDWNRISGLFVRPNTMDHKIWARSKLAQFKSERTYGVHLWNKQTSGRRIEQESVIGKLISDRCLICKDIFIS